MNPELPEPVPAPVPPVVSEEWLNDYYKKLDCVFVVCDLEKSIMKFFWKKEEADEYMRWRRDTKAPLYMKVVMDKDKLDYVHDY